MSRLHFKIILMILVSLLQLSFANALSSKQSQFIDFMTPKIIKANQTIMQQRNKLLGFYKDYSANHKLNQNAQNWLNQLAKSYKVTNPDFQKEGTWQQLLAKVDIVPTALVLAQAINESAWGQSRFAKEGNNYFGQWCKAPGCGLVPKKRKPGSPWQVRKFNNAYASIASYMKNINSNRAYDELRRVRFELRESGKPLNPSVVAEGLGNYSQRGNQYITMMQNIIHNFQLAQVVKNHSARA